MPSKKNQTPNSFFFFMQSLRPQLQRQGVVLQNGNKTLAEIAGPRWAQLTEEEKQPFVEMAKEQKLKKRYANPCEDNKMDCTRQLISKRVDTVALNEQRRRKERKQVIEGWTGKDVCDECFLFIGFMSLCNMPDDQYMPCEMAVVEFSLRYGIRRQFHKFIDPGTIPLGYRYEAMSQSEATHQIPPEGLATDTYHTIYEEFLKFVNPRRQPVFPPLYCKSSETKLTEFSLQWLATKAGSSNKLKKVYELEGLVCDLYAESAEAESKIAPSNHQASELLSSTVFDYEPGSRCKWHEDKEIRYCAAGVVTRYCYCLSDFLCGAFGIEMTSRHLPERPDDDSCTVITPKISDSGGRNARGLQEKQGRKEMESRNSAQDYRTNNGSVGTKKTQYTRRGPTYDEESLRTPNEGIVPVSATAAPSQTPAPVMGRGRGRGCAVPVQPLRRPNVPGVAASGGKIPARNGTVVQDTSNQNDNHDTPESPWVGSFGAGRGKGRGLRPPKTTPKVWAGGPTAPHPSVAPLPPSSWQQNDKSFPGSNSVLSNGSVMQTNGVNQNIPSWASFGVASDPARGYFTYPRVNNSEARGTIDPALQENFQNFSLFDKDSYDY